MNLLTEGEAAALHTDSISRNHCLTFVLSTCKCKARVKVNAPKNPTSSSCTVLDNRVLFICVHGPCAYLMLVSLRSLRQSMGPAELFHSGSPAHSSTWDLLTCRAHTLWERSHNTAFWRVFLQRCVASMKQLSQRLQHVYLWPRFLDLTEQGRTTDLNRETDEYRRVLREKNPQTWCCREKKVGGMRRSGVKCYKQWSQNMCCFHGDWITFFFCFPLYHPFYFTKQI